MVALTQRDRSIRLQFRLYRWGEIEILDMHEAPLESYLYFADVEYYDAKISGEIKIVKVYKARETFLHARSILKLVRYAIPFLMERSKC